MLVSHSVRAACVLPPSGMQESKAAPTPCQLTLYIARCKTFPLSTLQALPVANMSRWVQTKQGKDTGHKGAGTWPANTIRGAQQDAMRHGAWQGHGSRIGSNEKLKRGKCSQGAGQAAVLWA